MIKISIKLLIVMIIVLSIFTLVSVASSDEQLIILSKNMYGAVERASLVETYFEVNLQPKEGELNIQIPPGIIVLQTNIPPISKEPQISKYFFNLIQVYRGEIWRFKTNETIQVAFSYETEADKINKYMYNLN